MNIFAIVRKQMRQRLLGTTLTVISVALGVGLTIAIMILQREGSALFGQREYGCDLIVGAKGSPLQLTLNTLYHLDRSPGNIPYSVYETLTQDPAYASMVLAAVPYAVGDSYAGQRIVGTTSALFGVGDDGVTLPDDEAMHYRLGKRFALAEGKIFHARRLEAVIGSQVAQRTGLVLGSRFKATHGLPAHGQKAHVHEEQEWTVVGVLAATGTANDRVLFIPLESFYAIADHEAGMRAQAAIKQSDHGHHHDDTHDTHDAAHGHAGEKSSNLDADGNIRLRLPKRQWQISAVLVRTPGSFAASKLMYQINNGNDAAAVNPATTMLDFFRTFLAPAVTILQVVSFLVTIVAAVGILVGIYNAVSARAKDIAIMRALGATRWRVVAIVCIEAGLVGLGGSVLGLVLGHVAAAGASVMAFQALGEGFDWTQMFTAEWIYVAIVVGMSVIAGLVPALKAYRTPVAANLVG